MPLREQLHKLVADPRVYNVVSVVLGGPIVRRRLQARATDIAERHRGTQLNVVDVGGGTGVLESLWPPLTMYMCLDPDERKLSGFVNRDSRGAPVLAGGDHIPLRPHSVDVAIMVAVSHHLTDAVFDRTLAEIGHVLKPDGRLLYLDAVWNPSFLPGRILWRYDRGAYPRDPGILVSLLERYFTWQFDERFRVLHDYLVWIGAPKDTNVGDDQSELR